MDENRWSKENVELVVNSSKNKSEALNKLGLKPFTGNYDTLNKYIKEYHINCSHFTIGYEKSNVPTNKISLNEIIIADSTYTNRSSLKRRLFKEGLKKPICEKCGQDEIWNGEKMSLILDHINGINNDNRLENLRIVCPNCNSTLPTHCGKNIKKKSSAFYNGKLCDCGKKLRKHNISGYCKKCLGKKYSKNNSNETMHKFCSCGKEINSNSKKCLECHNKNNRKVERPTKEQLIIDVNELGYSGTGRKYGVSDNAIRKWVKFDMKN